MRTEGAGSLSLWGPSMGPPVHHRAPRTRSDRDFQPEIPFTLGNPNLRHKNCKLACFSATGFPHRNLRSTVKSHADGPNTARLEGTCKQRINGVQKTVLQAGGHTAVVPVLRQQSSISRTAR